MNTLRRIGRKVIQFSIPILILSVGAGAFAALAGQKGQSERVEREDPTVAVEARVVHRGDHDIAVTAQGWVIPAREAIVSPQVAGRIVWQSPALVTGGRVAAGDVLVRLESRDHRLAVRAERARVERAELELEIEHSRKRVAEAEWRLFDRERRDERRGSGPGPATTSNRGLVLRESQLRAARVGVEAARSALDRAELAVGRTSITAPFDAVVTHESAELGQMAAPQSPLATLVGIEHFLVEASVPVEHVPAIAIPGTNQRSDSGGARARVWQVVSGERVSRAGQVVRALGTLDSTGGMARVQIEVASPLAVGQSPEGQPTQAEFPAIPLFVGSFVEVEIAAGQLAGVIEIPRTGLRDDDRVYLIEDGVLVERRVEVVWRTGDHVLVKDGLEDGDRVITSRLASAVPGMRVRLADTASSDVHVGERSER